MNRLIITCPDCHVKESIGNLFEGKNFLISSMGAVSNPKERNFTDEITSAIYQHNIHEIVLVLSHGCTFHGFDQYNEHHGYHKAFAELIIENSLQQQLKQLNKMPLIAKRLDSCHLVTKGFVYDRQHRQLREFHEISTHRFLN